ncbi:vesicular glutamate transporter 3-like [Mytilus edulis]|uniref:vesicular glutamate transporter 3-like n=1 Tax=Mytilus edulis TaxID=6550 RepID=UPI0039F06652
MGCPKRFLVVFLGFCGLLLSIGYRSVFAMVMVHIVKPTHSSTNDTKSDNLFKHCIPLNSSCNLSLNWTVDGTLYLNTAYFVGGLFTQVPGGILATRFSPVRICGLSVLLSSICMVVLPVCIQYNQYVAVLVVRALQGVIEGPSVPAINGVISAWAPRSEKSRMITIAYAGAYLSPAVAMIVSGALSCHVCWHAVLYLYGGLGILWSIIFMIIVVDSPGAHPNLSVNERSLYDREASSAQRSSTRTASAIPWKHILTSLPMSAIFVGSFCRNWIFSMLLTEIPTYLQDSFHHLSIFEIGLLSSISEVCMTIVTVTGGVLIDTLIKSGLISTTVGRKMAQCSGFGIEAVCIICLGFITQLEIVMIVMCVGVAFSGLAISGYQVNPLDLSQTYASVLTGISRTGVIGAILSTLTASILRGRPGIPYEKTWHEVFWIAGAIHLAGVLYYGIFASGQRQFWADGHSLGTERLVNPSSDPKFAQVPDDMEHEHLLSRSITYNSIPNEDKEEGDDSADWFLQSM